MQKSRLDAVLKYKMTKLEALSFRVALLWEEITQKEFPNERFVRLRIKGDPRKSLLFKYCYTFVRQTQGILDPKEYRFYILAQIQLMSKMKNGEIHALLEPCILVGPKAWIRWTWWKSKYDKNMRILTTNADDLKLIPQIESVKRDLLRTKKFLGEISEEKVQQWFADKKLQEWIAINKISPYFILLHPMVQAFLVGKSINKVFERDLSIYKISDEIKTVFAEVYQDQVVKNQVFAAKVCENF